MVLRHDGRRQEELRPLKINVNPLLYPLGSVLLEQGDTKVLCGLTATKNEPAYLTGKNEGNLEVTLHFLPFSKKGAPDQNEEESPQFITQCLRSIMNFSNIPYQLSLHCEVLQDAGSVLTTALNASFMTLYLGIRHLLQENKIQENPLTQTIAGMTCGFLDNGEVAVDLDHYEEAKVKTKMQLVMTEEGDFVEVKAAGIKAPFLSNELNGLIFRGKNAIEELIKKEKEALLTESFEKEPQVLVVATKNQGKAREFEKMFAPLGFQIKTLLDYPEIGDIPETGQTFEENARLKAEGISGILQQVVLADDSGLKVDALEGLPGIYSARFAGPHKSDASNNAKLLAELAEVPQGKRQGQFYCALAVAAPQKETLTVHGVWEGEIATIPKGEDGFGYDPLFYLPDLGKTAAELTAEEKNRLSHRGKALQNLLQKWPNWWEDEK